MKQYKNTKYKISESGDVYSEYSNKVLRQRVNNSGYKIVDLYIDKQKYTFLTHKLVGFCFVKNKSGLKEINHIDQDKLNNHFSNLEWCTRSHNISDSYRKGRTVSEVQKKAVSLALKGKSKTKEHNYKNGLSKLSIDKDMYLNIISMYIPNKHGVIKTAKELNISTSIVQRVVSGKLDKYFKK